MYKALGRRPETTRELRGKVFQAILMMEERYSNPLSAQELADSVGLSLSHLHNAFRTVVGESLFQHQLRLRLERAAIFLQHSDWEVGEVALVSGFETHASFSRAFRRLYGLTPRQFRKSRTTKPFLRSHLRRRDSKDESWEGDLLLPTVRLEEWPDCSLICLRAYSSIEGILEPWRELMEWASQHLPGLEGCRFFGLWFDDWKEEGHSRYRYECAILAPQLLEKGDLPAPFFLRSFSKGPMAITFVEGSVKVIEESWERLMMGWLPVSGYLPRGDFVFDEYSAELMLSKPWKSFVVSALGGLKLQLCLPLQRESMSFH